MSAHHADPEMGLVRPFGLRPRPMPRRPVRIVYLRVAGSSAKRSVDPDRGGDASELLGRAAAAADDLEKQRFVQSLLLAQRGDELLGGVVVGVEHHHDRVGVIGKRAMFAAEYGTAIAAAAVRPPAHGGGPTRVGGVLLG